MKMNKKNLSIGLVCVLVTLLILAGGEALTALALPFTLVGDGLRALSLSGGVGNVAAIVIYVLLCLSPLALMARKKRERMDIWLLTAAGVLFHVLYLMVNPGMRPAGMRNEVGDLIYAGSVYSVLLAWAVGKLMKAADTNGVNIYQALRAFLTICAVELAVVGIFGGTLGFMDKVKELQKANTMPGVDLTLTYLFQGLISAGTMLEYGLDAVVMWLGVKLLKEVEADPYSEACAHASRKLQDKCKSALLLIVGVNAALNVGQVVFAGKLHDIDASVSFPVFSMALVFVTLALTRLLMQGKELKDDNDLFI